MDLDYPLHFDGRARTAEADLADHVRDMIEQILFTQPGERVNRPDFGAGVMQMVFGPASPEVAAAAEFLVRGALQQWLGDRIEVQRVDVTAVDATLAIAIDYVLLATGETASAEFARGGSG